MINWVGVWMLSGIISAIVANRRDAAKLGCLVGVILGPLGIIAAFFIRGNHVECSHCRELVHVAARVCPHCRRETDSGQRTQYAKRIARAEIISTAMAALLAVVCLAVVVFILIA